MHDRYIVNSMLGQGLLGDSVTTRLASEQYGASVILCVDTDEANKFSSGPEGLPTFTYSYNHSA